MSAVSAGWRQAAALPKALCRFSLVAWNEHLLAFGGETEFGKAVNTDVLEYGPAADVWSVR
jgi:N-acetylneuraminic acid mutarotase